MLSLGLVFGLGLGIGLVMAVQIMTVQILTVQMLTVQIKTGNQERHLANLRECKYYLRYC